LLASSAVRRLQSSTDMRMGMVVAFVASSAIGHAEAFEAKLRVGASMMRVDSQDTYKAAPTGVGPYLDGQLALRSDYVSFAVFGSWYTLHANTDANDQSTDVKASTRYDVIDLGGRIEVHERGPGGPFFGLGIALEEVRDAGTATQCACVDASCDPCDHTTSGRFAVWSHTPLFEVHAGVELPSLGPIAPEVFALFGYSVNPDDSNDSALAMTARLAVGARW
jgi:hypothetical protein